MNSLSHGHAFITRVEPIDPYQNPYQTLAHIAVKKLDCVACHLAVTMAVGLENTTDWHDDALKATGRALPE